MNGNYFNLAGMTVKINCEDRYIYADLNEFRVEEERECALECNIHFNEEIEYSRDKKLIESPVMLVYRDNGGYIFEYPCEQIVKVNRVNEDGSMADMYVYTDEERESDAFDIFLSFRDIFFYMCQQQGKIAVHSSSIIYDDRAYLFSACSGTGKTTHTNLWVDRYGVEILDGDVCILSREDDKVYAYGIPWCGTSGKYQNKRVEAGGIIFLAQGKVNMAKKLIPFEGILRLSARCLSPSWNEELTDKILKISEGIAMNIDAYILQCDISTEAVETIKALIDEN